MKTLITALFLVSIALLAPSAPAQAEDGIGSLFGTHSSNRSDTRRERRAAKKRHESALQRREYEDDSGFEESTSKSSFERRDRYSEESKTYKDDRSVKFKRPKRTTPELDTWGRNGGQTKTSEEVLRDMMTPKKRRN